MKGKDCLKQLAITSQLFSYFT